MRVSDIEDVDMAEMSKRARKLSAESEKLMSRVRKKAAKKLIVFIPLALSFDKWVIGRMDKETERAESNLGHFEFSISFERYDNNNYATTKAANNIRKSTRSTSQSVLTNGALLSKAGKPIKNKRVKSKRVTHLNIKSYRDFLDQCDKWDCREFCINKCYISFNYNSISFTSYDNSKCVFDAVKHCKIPIQLASIIKDIEEAEKSVLQKKAMLKQLNEQMLFSI